MGDEYQIAIAFAIVCISAVYFFFTVRCRIWRSRSDCPSRCYLWSETKPQLSFKSVLADNSFSHFKHRKPNVLSDENSLNIHPYEAEIMALVETPQIDLGLDLSANVDQEMTDSLIWVDTKSHLHDLAHTLSKEIVFAVDTEQHSLRSYLGFTALVQVSTRWKDYLLDTIALHDEMDILCPVFANPSICKVFHGADSDVLWLQRDFHIYIVNLFDTAKACEVLGKPQKSLAYLLETYSRVIKNKLIQREDWRKRPLSMEMLQYAWTDAHYLLHIANNLIAELKRQDNDVYSHLLSETYRRSNMICLQLYTKDMEDFPGKGAAYSIYSRHLNDQGGSSVSCEIQDRLIRLCMWRDIMARVHDESLRFVLSDEAILSIADKAPATSREIHDAIVVADSNAGFSSDSPPIPSPVVRSHLNELCSLIQHRERATGDASMELIQKSIGLDGSCPLSACNYALLLDSRVANNVGSKSMRVKNMKDSARKASRERFVRKFSCKSPVYHNCRIYANDGRLLCYCDHKKLQWYLARDLAKLVEENPAAIMLLFEPKGRPEDEDNDFYIQSKKNICVGCGEGRHYLRYRIIPSCYRVHFPEHLKSHRSHDIVLLCVDCHEAAHAAAEKYKKLISVEFGIPLFVHMTAADASAAAAADASAAAAADASAAAAAAAAAADDDDASSLRSHVAALSPLHVRSAAMALVRHGSKMPAKRREELLQVLLKFYGQDGIDEEDLEEALIAGTSHRERRRGAAEKRNSAGGVNDDDAPSVISDATISGSETGSHNREPSRLRSHGEVGFAKSKCKSSSLLGGHDQHGRRVVEQILKEHGDGGVNLFCQKWRQVFVSSIHPRFLPAGWNVMHSGKREFGEFSVFHPARSATIKNSSISTVFD